MRLAALSAALATTVLAARATEFGAPVDISAAGQNADQHQVAFYDGQGGRAVVVWRNANGSDVRIQARTFLPAFGGQATAIESLSKAGLNAALPQVAVYPFNNTALIVWRNDDARIQGRQRAVLGELGPVQTFGRSEGFDSPSVTGSSVVWTAPATRIRGRQITLLGDLGPTESISGGFSVTPQIGGSDSSTAVVWRHGTARHVIQVRRGPDLGALGPIQNVGRGHTPILAMNAGGNAALVWFLQVAGGGTPHYRIYSRTLSAAGALGPTQLVRGVLDAHAAVNTSGSALLVWTSRSFRIQAGVPPAAPLTLSESGQQANSPRIALDPGDNAMVVWRRFDGTNWRIQARSLSAAGALGPVQTLSAAGQDAAEPRVAAYDIGNFVAVWKRSDGTNSRIQAAWTPFVPP